MFEISKIGILIKILKSQIGGSLLGMYFEGEKIVFNNLTNYILFLNGQHLQNSERSTSKALKILISIFFFL